MLPFALIPSLGVAALIATAALTLLGPQNSVYTQIGIVLLIGLASTPTPQMNAPTTSSPADTLPTKPELL